MTLGGTRFIMLILELATRHLLYIVTVQKVNPIRMARTKKSVYIPKAETEIDDCSGFTLLEILVVMAIFAGLIAIAVPALSTLFLRVRASFQRSDIEQQLLLLPQEVRDSGRGGVLGGADLKADSGDAAKKETAPADDELEHSRPLSVSLPGGWTMHVAKPIYYHFTGACTGGEVDFSVSSHAFHYVLAAPLCRPQLAGPQ